jgi:hypothetical protein
MHNWRGVGRVSGWRVQVRAATGENGGGRRQGDGLWWSGTHCGEGARGRRRALGKGCGGGGMGRSEGGGTAADEDMGAVKGRYRRKGCGRGRRGNGCGEGENGRGEGVFAAKGTVSRHPGQNRAVPLDGDNQKPPPAIPTSKRGFCVEGSDGLSSRDEGQAKSAPERSLVGHRSEAPRKIHAPHRVIPRIPTQATKTRRHKKRRAPRTPGSPPLKPRPLSPCGSPR